MKLKDFSTEVELILADEQLIRLLHYTPKNGMDDPFEVTAEKPNIMELDNETKWEIIRQHLIPAIKEDDLESQKTCRLFYYPGAGNPTNGNYLFSNQQYCFDIVVHYDFQIADRRLEMIADRINELIFNKRIYGVGKTLFRGRRPVRVSSKEYVAFQLVYEFCVENY